MSEYQTQYVHVHCTTLNLYRYALYLVLLKKVVKHHEALDIPMFFGITGLAIVHVDMD